MPTFRCGHLNRRGGFSANSFQCIAVLDRHDLTNNFDQVGPIGEDVGRAGCRGGVVFDAQLFEQGRCPTCRDAKPVWRRRPIGSSSTMAEIHAFLETAGLVQYKGHATRHARSEIASRSPKTTTTVPPVMYSQP